MTLVGLLIMASSCVIVLWHSPKLTAELPAWVYLYTAFALFAYQSLDAIDGKQARRTGMAGPLGELFDHGCDAVNLMLTGLVIPALFRVEPNLMCMSLMVLGFLAFYLATWEEYHTSSLYFGWLSGPVEGTLALISLCLFSAYVGGAFWLKNISLPFGLGIIKTNMVIVYSTIFLALITVVFAFKNAFTTSGFAAIWRAVPFLFFMSTCVALYAANPELSTFPNYILYFLICGFAFASSVARIIAAHITKGDYPLWTPAYLPIIIAVLRTLNGKYQLIPHMLQGPLTRFLSISLVYNLVVYGRLIIGIISQLCQYLGINCLTVSKQRQE